MSNPHDTLIMPQSKESSDEDDHPGRIVQSKYPAGDRIEYESNSRRSEIYGGNDWGGVQKGTERCGDVFRTACDFDPSNSGTSCMARADDNLRAWRERIGEREFA